VKFPEKLPDTVLEQLTKIDFWKKQLKENTYI
jgi:hypothetical protein